MNLSEDNDVKMSPAYAITRKIDVLANAIETDSYEE